MNNVVSLQQSDLPVIDMFVIPTVYLGKDAGKTKQKTKSKYFVITSDEAFREKKKKEDEKREAERMKEEKRIQRENKKKVKAEEKDKKMIEKMSKKKKL